MMKPDIIRKHVIIPALSMINSYSEEAEALVFNTGAAESLYLHRSQLGGGPALGFWQMEPKTHDDIWSNFLGSTRKQYLIDGLALMSDNLGAFKELYDNPWYAAAMCRIHYLRFSPPLPDKGNIMAQGEYWKHFYNTEAGAGTVGGFMEKVTKVIMQ